MAYRRPDSFDGLGFHHGRDAPLYGAQWVTEPPDIPGSRNPYPGERTPQHGDETAGEHGGLKPAWDATQPGPPPAEQLSRFAGFGIGLVSLFTENVLAHPCIVFRRQCQVNYHARCLHLTPFTSVGVMYAITKAQGVKSLWKGMGSTFIVHGISLGAEGIISEFTPLPRELPHRWSWKQLAGHLLLKGLTAIVALPFYCASLIETVQSDIVRDESSSGLLDCVREGLTRVLGVGAPHSRRLLPVSSLLAPAALHAVLRYAVAASVQRAALWVYQRGKRQQDSNRSNMAADGSDRPKMASASDPLESYFPELAAAWLGSLVADVLLFPLETALHRLALQGTRTIIDATDGASSILASSSAASPLVLPVNTQYDGFKDCLHAIRRKEGNVGFYRGFGALVTQYAIHGALLAAARTLLRLLLQEGAKLS